VGRKWLQRHVEQLSPPHPVRENINNKANYTHQALAYLELDFGGESVAMVNDGFFILPIPTVQLHTAATRV